MTEARRSRPGLQADGERSSGRDVVCALEGRTADSIGDEALVELVRRGDRRAAAQLYDRYAPLVRRLISRSFGPSEDVKDLSQEVFIAVVQGLDRLRDPSRLRSFIYGVAVNTVRMALRQRRRRWFVVFGWEPRTEPVAPSVRDEPRRAVQCLYDLLDSFDEKERMAFVLRYIEQLPLAHIASLLGWSVATTKRRLGRTTVLLWARARAVPELQPYLPQSDDEHGNQEQGDG
jgi:RNA polymerase sigma-70 factor (ECF subfamily)